MTVAAGGQRGGKSKLVEQNLRRLPERCIVWFVGVGIDVYLRKTARIIDGQLRPTLDLANIEAKRPGGGTFTAFLEMVERVFADRTIYIENVMTPRFAQFLERRGYTEVDGCDPELPCFYRLPITDRDSERRRYGND